jgi:hypothetical protein
LKKELDVIKEEENEDEFDLDMNTKKMGGSVHLYKIDIKDLEYKFENKNNIKNNSLAKSNIVSGNEKNEIKNKLIGKKNDKYIVINNIQNSNKNIENQINIEKNEIQDENNKDDNNIIINKEKNEENEIDIITNNNNKNENENNINQENKNEIHNTITLKEIKQDNIIMSEFDLVQKIKQGTQNLVPKKVVFKKKFKNTGNVKYSSISSHDFQKKKGYFSTTQRRNIKNKVAEALNDNNDESHHGKNKNCNIF